MADGTVNIRLRSSGGSQVAGELGKVSGGIADVRKGVGILAGSLGELGGKLTRLLGGIFTGSVWEIGARVISGAISLWNKWRDAAAEAAEEVRRKTDEMVTANSKLVASIKEAAAAQATAIDRDLERRELEIDKVKELTKAEIELARQREIAAAKGDERKIAAANRRADKRLADVDIVAAEQKAAERKAAAEQSILQRKAAADMAKYAWEEAEAMNQSKKRAYLDAEDAAARKAVQQAEVMLAAIQQENYKGLSDADRAKEEAAAREAFANSKEGRALSKDLESHSDGALKEAKKALDDANAAVKAAEEARQDAIDSAVLIAKNREIAAAKAVAKERERLDREAHARRMADLRAENAEQSKAASRQSAIASAAQSEFDKAFAMYRDPSRAASVIGEEKDYRADLERLHADARRYGGKWRIDELSSLMAAGDTQGVSDTLASWRKTKGFTPEVEAMVRASAAEQTKATAEDELRRLNATMEGMNAKMQELSTTTSDKLGEIASNTSGLADKVEYLMTLGE